MSTITATLQQCPVMMLGHLVGELDDVSVEIEVEGRNRVSHVKVIESGSTRYATPVVIDWDTGGETAPGIMDRAQDYVDAHAELIAEAEAEEREYRREYAADVRERYSAGI